MANENNLVPVRSENEAREKGKKGGINSGKARREKANFRKVAAGLIQGDEMQQMILALVRSASDEKNRNQVAAFRELERLLGQDRTAAETREQNARIAKLKAETERLQRSDAGEDNDGVEVIFRGEEASDR